jgi:hypothetical protein
LGTGALTMESSRATRGSMKSTPLEMIAVAVRAAPAVPLLMPETESIR